MRTTIDFPDGLMKELKRRAVEQDTTVRQIVIESVQHALSSAPRPSKFKLRDLSVPGGLVPELQEASWQTIQQLSYHRNDDAR
ncbi:MAG TPA: hypothetical protein PLD59_07205 [Tepidisphaeraceae bacterium]|nr:hypothetical protein [Tepidisphaeraceae bacterium]